MSKLEQILNESVESFTAKATSDIQSGAFFAKGNEKTVNVTTNQIKNALKKYVHKVKPKLLQKICLSILMI